MVQVFAPTNIFNQPVFIDNQIAVRQQWALINLTKYNYPACCTQARKDHTQK